MANGRSKYYDEYEDLIPVPTVRAKAQAPCVYGCATVDPYYPPRGDPNPWLPQSPWYVPWPVPQNEAAMEEMKKKLAGLEKRLEEMSIVRKLVYCPRCGHAFDDERGVFGEGASFTCPHCNCEFKITAVN